MFGTARDEDFLNDLRRSGRVRTGRGGWAMTLLILAGIGVFLAWAALFEIDEVTRASGRVVPSQQVQVVQSLEGGIVRRIEVRQGDIVEAGQVLMQIDDTALSSQRGELLKQEAALLAEEIRLRAEVAFDRQPDFPQDLLARAPEAVMAELDVLNSRFDQLDSELAVLRSQLDQRRAALEELLAERTKLETVIAPLREELELTEGLVGSGAVPRIELLRLRARLADLEGDLAIGRAQAPNLTAAIREAETQIEVARASYVTAARTRLARLGMELAVVRESLRAAEDRVTRTELRAPVRGTVNALNVTTTGQVVQPGAALAEIVPVGDALEIEVNVPPKDVAFIRPGDTASVKITAYDYLVYGALAGEVARIGADTIRDGDGNEFFQLTIVTDRTDLGRDGQSLPVTPGMVATVDIQTGRRTVLSYLIQPVLRMQSEALREG
jgi:membrane fusion protein, adhesin transport system